MFPVEKIEPVNAPEFGDDTLEREAEQLEQKLHASLGAGWDDPKLSAAFGDLKESEEVSLEGCCRTGIDIDCTTLNSI